jgi:hypothetical protein
LTETGAVFGISHYSTIGRAIKLVKIPIARDKGLANALDQLTEKFTKSQRKVTPFPFFKLLSKIIGRRFATRHR